jgi:hypothetical protein
MRLREAAQMALEVLETGWKTRGRNSRRLFQNGGKLTVRRWLKMISDAVETRIK